MAALNGAGEAEGGGGCKRRYRALKRRLRLLLYEQECFQEELRRAQRKLLKVSRDKSFLLDRLLQYENVDDDSSDSEATASSENSDGEGAKETPPAKRRRSASPPPPGPAPTRAPPAPFAVGSPPFSPFPTETRPARPRPGPTRRHRGSRRPTAALAPPEPPPTLPRRLLSDGPEGSDGDGGEGDNEDDDNGDDELVIDIPE